MKIEIKEDSEWYYCLDLDSKIELSLLKPFCRSLESAERQFRNYVEEKLIKLPLRKIEEEKEKEIQRKYIEEEEKREREKIQKRKQERWLAWQVINAWECSPGGGIANEANSEHEAEFVKAVRIIRSGWNRDRTMFVMISSSGKSARYYYHTDDNLPSFAKNR